MKLKSKSLLKFKKIIANYFNVGVSRLRLTPKALQQIQKKDNLDRKASRDLISKKVFRVIPKKKRTYKIYYAESANKRPKDKVKPTKSLRYLLKRKICTRKDIWIRKVRALRAALKQRKNSCTSQQYRSARNKIKGNAYLNVKDLLDKL